MKINKKLQNLLKVITYTYIILAIVVTINVSNSIKNYEGITNLNVIELDISSHEEKTYITKKPHIINYEKAYSYNLLREEIKEESFDIQILKITIKKLEYITYNENIIIKQINNDLIKAKTVPNLKRVFLENQPLYLT